MKHPRRTAAGASAPIRARAAQTVFRAAAVDANRRDAPRVVLGDDHPLTCACEAYDRLIRDAIIVAAALIASILAVVEGARWAAAIVLAATIVLVTVGCIVAALGQRKRDHALDLIGEGHGTMPLGPVRRECRRLRADRTRGSLARTFDRIVDEALSRPALRVRGIRPLYERAVVAAVAPDLRAVSRLIRTERASAQGLALAERLLRYGMSPLCGHDAAALRAELRHILGALNGA